MFRIINIDPYFFGWFTMNLFSFSRFKYEITRSPMNKFWVHYYFRELTMNSLGLSWKNFEFTISFRESTFNSIFFFANSLSIQNLFSQIHYEFPIFFANSLGIYYLLREFTMNSFFRESTIYLRVHFQFTIYFANSLSIHCLFDESNNDLLSFWRNH